MLVPSTDSPQDFLLMIRFVANRNEWNLHVVYCMIIITDKANHHDLVG